MVSFRAGLACVCAALIFITCPVLHAAAPQLPSYFLRVRQTEEGLPHNAVSAVVQTRDGYLWLGTYDGLARFDGATFTVFDNNNTPEMRNSRVTSLFEDGEGNLWIGHETGELTRCRDGHFKAVEVTAAWESRRILDIGSDQTGKIWLLNEEGRMASVNGDEVSAPNAGTSTTIAVLERGHDGRIWMLYGGVVFALENGRLIPLVADSETIGGYVTGICAGRDGGLWIVSGGRVRKWDGHALVDDLGPAPWDPSPISKVIETRDGYLAVGTLEKGLYLILPHRGVIAFNRENGFPHDWVRSLEEDREGTLWAGTGSGGLVALRAGKVTTVDAPDKWQGRVVLSVNAAKDGALWIGTEGAGLYRLLDGEWTHFGANNGLSNQYVWSVSEDAQGRLWAGTWGEGVFVRQGDRFEHPAGLENLTVPTPAICHTTNGVVWIGTGTGLLRYESGASTLYGRKDGLSLPDVRSVVEDHKGTIWFGMLGGGLGRLHNGEVRQFGKQDGLSSDYVQCLYLDADGALWIGTYGGGLNRFKQGRFVNVTTSQGLPNNFICDIEDDGHGNLWVSSHGGIFRLRMEELNLCADGKAQSVPCLSYGMGDGMPTLECSGGLQPAGCKTADGRLWFPTSKGLVVVDPDDAKVNQLPPPVVIEKLLVDGRAVTGITTNNLPLQIPPGRQRFDFFYSGLSFVAPEKVQFQYRLEGLESEWMDAGTKRSINYSFIPPGTYTFHVRACNSDGVWNETGAALAFVVQPHLWQTWWFRVLAGLAAAGLLSGAVLLEARRRMRRKFERLERQRAIERERARIAQDIHDNLGASLTRISLLSQSAQGELDDSSHAATQLNRIYDTARELTRSMDEIVWAVNPQHDTLDSLASYLGKFAQDFLGPIHIRCRLDVPEQLPPWPPTAEVRHNLFLAFKEAINNVVKHAAASEVYVALKIEPDAFTVSVRDNGKGFTPDAPAQQGPGEPGRIAGGNGLANMRRRLEKIGGHCDIRSAPGQGTEVRFVVAAAVHSP
jgi:signal transduction histidine kinase/ligand-binding sensor domain-containing protein